MQKFQLCFHDLSVANYRKVLPLLDRLRDVTGRPFSVLVIPSTEGASCEEIAGFKEALATLRECGFELALHGYRHVAEYSRGRSLYGLAALKMANNEAEFAGLKKGESERLLNAALEAWSALDLGEPAAFVPPTWFSNRHLLEQVTAQGMVYEQRFCLVKPTGNRLYSPVLSFAGMPELFQMITFAAAENFFVSSVHLVRIALHPVDFEMFEEQIYKLVKCAAEKRELALYSEL